MSFTIPIRIPLAAICVALYAQASLSVGIEDGASLSIAKKLIKNIQDDEENSSFKEMIDNKVMQEHTLSHHDKNQPYFYTDDLFSIANIINLVLAKPQGIIDETAQTGTLTIYREFDYPKEIKDFFGTGTKAPRKFQDAYLGQTITGPTNKVAVILKIKGDEQSENTLEKRLAYTKNNIQYLDAYPVKGSPPVPKPPEIKPEGEATEGDAEEEGNMDGE